MPFYETRDRVPIYYEARGSGDPVVFVHGLTANHRHFKYQVRAFKETHRVVVYDLRGHGASGVPDYHLNIAALAEDLKELIDYLGVSPVTLVGWSLGAHVIFEFIERFGTGGIKRFAIIDMAPRLMKQDPGGRVEPWAYGLRGLSGVFGDFGNADNTKMMAAITESDWQVFARNLVERLQDRELVKNGVFDYDAEFKGKGDMAWLFEEAMRNRPYVIASLWASMLVRDYRLLLDGIHVPVLIAYGEGSNYYPAENSRYMHERLKDSTLVSFPGCGHAPHIQDPQRFNRVLADFVTAG